MCLSRCSTQRRTGGRVGDELFRRKCAAWSQNRKPFRVQKMTALRPGQAQHTSARDGWELNFDELFFLLLFLC